MKKIMPIFIITVYALLCMSCFCCVFVPNIRVKNSTKDTILVSALWKKGKMNETCIRLEPDKVIYIAYGKGSVLIDSNDSDDDENAPVLNVKRAVKLKFKSPVAETMIVDKKNILHFINQERVIITSSYDLPTLSQ